MKAGLKSLICERGKAPALFCNVIAVILFVISVATLSSLSCTSHIWESHDPILLITNKWVFILTGTTDLGLSAFLLMSDRQEIKLAFIAWFATNTMIYRLCVHFVGGHYLFSDIGNITNVYLFSPKRLDAAINVLLYIMLAGSYGLLFVKSFGDRWAIPIGFRPSQSQSATHI
jgi:hypothetical protein